MNIEFMIKRLMRMSAREINHRFVTQFQHVVDQTKVGKDGFDDQLTETPSSLFCDDLVLPVYRDLIREADLICNNQFDLFALHPCDAGKIINFHKDYKSGLSAPQDKYCYKIDYRNAAVIGDVKYIWETNRHLQLTQLALAYNMTNDQKYATKCLELLREWLTQNPFMMGINWTSALELGIRLINWTFTMHLLEGRIDGETHQNWVNSIYQHCWYIDRNFSRFSSANNHLIGEAAGLFVASTALPRFNKSEKWQDRSFNILVSEATKQQHSDGVNKEQAIAYQQFVLDFLLIAGLVGERYGKHFPATYWYTVEAMCEYLHAMENVQGILPHIGDEDDGYVIDAGQKRIGAHRSILNTAARLFNRREWQDQQNPRDLKTELLVGIASLEPEKILSKIPSDPENAIIKTEEIREAFTEGGYYLLQHHRGTENEQKLIFDCGPLGYLSIAAHGHADALSIYFSAGGCPIFIDPGTYAYHAHKKWRNYFRSTKAHNTVCVDNEDQSAIAGNFMWSQKATATLLDYQKGVSVKGKHDGYSRFGKTGVIHQREVVYDQSANEWHIIDELIGKGRHTIDICFHLDQSCRIHSQEETYVAIQFPKGICRLAFEKGMDCHLYFGEDALPLGWQSTAYDLKEPTHTLILSKTMEGNETILTTFQVDWT